MAWIESHQTLGRHPKTMRLAQELKCDPPHAVGYLHFLWWWCLDYATDGVVALDAQPIAAQACFWKGKTDKFWQALLVAGFVDTHGDAGDARVHDWDDYAGRLLDKRAANAKRMRSARAKHVQDTFAPRAGATVHNSTGPEYAVAAAAAPVARAREDGGGGGGDFRQLGSLLGVPDEVRQRLERPPIEASQC